MSPKWFVSLILGTNNLLTIGIILKISGLIWFVVNLDKMFLLFISIYEIKRNNYSDDGSNQSTTPRCASCTSKHSKEECEACHHSTSKFWIRIVVWRCISSVGWLLWQNRVCFWHNRTRCHRSRRTLCHILIPTPLFNLLFKIFNFLIMFAELFFMFF